MREEYSLLLAVASGCLIFLITVGFAFWQSPEILSAAVESGAAVPHPLAGRSRCDGCHGPAGEIPYPLRHLGWSNASCTKCHPADH
ncbi:MAG: hypothetical protein AB1568_02555 [Thermodesulfobacteriota bacterium]